MDTARTWLLWSSLSRLTPSQQGGKVTWDRIFKQLCSGKRLVSLEAPLVKHMWLMARLVMSSASKVLSFDRQQVSQLWGAEPDIPTVRVAGNDAKTLGRRKGERCLVTGIQALGVIAGAVHVVDRLSRAQSANMTCSAPTSSADAYVAFPLDQLVCAVGVLVIHGRDPVVAQVDDLVACCARRLEHRVPIHRALEVVPAGDGVSVSGRQAAIDDGVGALDGQRLAVDSDLVNVGLGLRPDEEEEGQKQKERLGSHCDS